MGKSFFLEFALLQNIKTCQHTLTGFLIALLDKVATLPYHSNDLQMTTPPGLICTKKVKPDAPPNVGLFVAPYTNSAYILAHNVKVVRRLGSSEAPPLCLRQRRPLF